MAPADTAVDPAVAVAAAEPASAAADAPAPVTAEAVACVPAAAPPAVAAAPDIAPRPGRVMAEVGFFSWPDAMVSPLSSPTTPGDFVEEADFPELFAEERGATGVWAAFCA